MGLLDTLVEQRIAAAIEAGEFDDLPGQGRPLALDDDPLVAEELRVAHRILKNAGFLPPEVEVRREIADVATLLRRATDDDSRRRAIARLALLEVKLDAEGRALRVADRYRDKLLDRLDE